MDKRNTEQKKIILNELEKAGHPTASELYGIIHEINPKISRATVFRVLSGFAEDGVVRKLEFLGSDTRYDAKTYPHAHCHCVNCGKVVDIVNDRLKEVLDLGNICGFEIFSTEIEFNGVCPECAAKAH